MSWAKFHGVGYSLKMSKMMIRRTNVKRRDKSDDMTEGMMELKDTLAKL